MKVEPWRLSLQSTHISHDEPRRTTHDLTAKLKNNCLSTLSKTSGTNGVLSMGSSAGTRIGVCWTSTLRGKVVRFARKG